MKFNVEVDITVQEIFCWIGLFLVAWNPSGAFNGMIDAVGYKVTLLLLASGAGSSLAKKYLGK